MATFMFRDSWRGWEPLGDDIDLKEYGKKLCKGQAHHDSDNGYEYWVEFWRDGVRTVAYAEYDCYSRYYELEGDMNSFIYGPIEEINKSGCHNAEYVKLHKYTPDRDWIIL